MDTNQKRWNRRQKKLRRLLEQSQATAEALDLFFTQHAELHSSKIGSNLNWSFEDKIFENLDEDGFRSIPPKHEHSIAWLLWHIARIEDVTMSMLVAGKPQLFVLDGWLERLGIEWSHTGNAMSSVEIMDLSQLIDFSRLRDYRLAVGQRTVDIISQIMPEQLTKRVDPACIQSVAESGAVSAAAFGVLDYWSKRTIAGLLLMPATRHNLIHLNEAERIKASILI
jgi:hypothetical protein